MKCIEICLVMAVLAIIALLFIGCGCQGSQRVHPTYRTHPELYHEVIRHFQDLYSRGLLVEQEWVISAE